MESSATAVAGMGARVIRQKKDTLFIIGLGSAGQRHARNALALGIEVVGYDPQYVGIGMNSPNLPSGIWLVPSIEVMLNKGPLGIIIATPPDTHKRIDVDIIRAGYPVLIEKPIADTTEGIEDVLGFRDICKGKVAVGYQFRFLPSLRDFRRQLVAGTVVQLLGGNFTFLSSEWCSRTYRADFLLEMSHEFDATRFLFGNPTHMFCAELTRDRFQGEARFGDYLGAPCIDYDFDGSPERKGYIRHATAITMGQDNLHWKFDKAENAQAYMAELQDFLAVCRGEKQPECTAEDGWWAIKMIEAIRKSDKTGKWEAV
jgi:predicted dehydrogenase